MYINDKLVNLKPGELEPLEPPEEYLLKWQNVQNKIQCFASGYALNNCFEDMHKVSQYGVWVAELYYFDHARYGCDMIRHYHFNVKIIKKDEKRLYDKKCYSFAMPYARYYFEIPNVRLFNEEQVKNWQIWCFKELKNTIEKNKKIRDIWLRKKNLLKDFGEDNEKEPI